MPAIAALTLVLGSGATAWVLLAEPFGTTVPSANQPGPAGQPAAETPISQAPAPSSAASSEEAADSENAALAKLAQHISLDRPRVRSELAETWVPQLSSKRLGIVVDGFSYRYVDILNDHRALRSTYDALLVWSGDWSSFGAGDFYVTVASMPFSTSVEANAWCDQQGLDADHCFAKRLSTIAGPDGSTVNR